MLSIDDNDIMTAEERRKLEIKERVVASALYYSADPRIKKVSVSKVIKFATAFYLATFQYMSGVKFEKKDIIPTAEYIVSFAQNNSPFFAKAGKSSYKISKYLKTSLGINQFNEMFLIKRFDGEAMCSKMAAAITLYKNAANIY